MITEEQWNQEAAAETVALAYSAETGKPVHITLLVDDEAVGHEIDKHLARAIAVRLVELAERLPEPPRILRRASDTDDGLREVDGL